MAPEPEPRGALPHDAARHRDEWGIEFSRIVAFSDGVFAIAITLLVLTIEIPQNSHDLTRVLDNQIGDFFAYALSFAVLGKLWLAHHRFFSALARFDSTLMGINLVYLAFVALVPFTSELLGDYSDQSIAVIFYAASMFAVSLTFTLQIVYSYRANLVKPEMRDVERRMAGPSNFIVAGLFLASIPVAAVAPSVAPFMWIGVFFTGRRVADRVAALRA
jgi:TMEM175 potassium channel family protein